METESPKPITLSKVDIQTLLDLGFPQNIWNTLSPETISKIVENYTSYKSFLKSKEKQISEKSSSQINEKYRLAFEKFSELEKKLREKNDLEALTTLTSVATLAGEGNNELIDAFLKENRGKLHKEEIEFLEVAKEYSLSKNK